MKSGTSEGEHRVTAENLGASPGQISSNSFLATDRLRTPGIDFEYADEPHEFGIPLRDHDADPQRELQGERFGLSSLPRTVAIPC